MVELPDHHLRVYNTHLEYLMADQRIRQVQELRRIVEEAPRQGPVVSAPDVDPIHLNEDWLSVDEGRLPTGAGIGHSGWAISTCGRTHPEYRLMVGNEDSNT